MKTQPDVGRRLRRRLLAFAGLVAGLVAVAYALHSFSGQVAGLDTLGSAPDAVALGEVFVRQALGSELAANFEWDAIAVSLNPLSISLSGVRARWQGAFEASVHSQRVELTSVSNSGLESHWEADSTLGALAGVVPSSARFEELRIVVPGVSSTGLTLALGELEVHRIAPRSKDGSNNDFAARGTPEIFGPTESALAGSGTLAGGGALRFELRFAGERFGVQPLELDLYFEGVPAREWALLAGELRDASGTISGHIELQASRSEEAVAASGRFEIDATRAGILVAGAYRKPVGDPATLSGSFSRNSRGEFEILEARVSVSKAKPSRGASREDGESK